MNSETLKELLRMQKNEITEYHVYSRLVRLTKDAHNKEILQRIARDEHEHYHFLQKVTGRQLKPAKLRMYWYILVAYVFGLSFGLKLMERGEEFAQDIYAKYQDEIGGLSDIAADEQKHENDLLDILEEDLLDYAGAIVLGLNDALVELTGALAGLTFALQNNKLVAITGLITGFAASLSMAASGYLSSKEDTPDE
ncbi:MAG: rubrerythrin family protein, partial [Caldithrix sp.]|nr:rubrerythrin family protein [Caldithrix sp.]